MQDDIPPARFGDSLTAALRLWQAEIDAALEARGFGFMTGARGQILNYLEPGHTSQARIANRAGISKQAVQQHLDALVRDGAITRETDPGDARRKSVRLTDHGRRALKASQEVTEATETLFESFLAPKRAKNFRRLIGLLLEATPQET